MGGVELVGAENSAGAKNINRQFALQQGANLNRRGVSSKNQVRLNRVDEEGVLHGACGVIRVKVERIEVEPFAFELWAFGDFPTHADEDVADLFLKQA